MCFAHQHMSSIVRFRVMDRVRVKVRVRVRIGVRGLRVRVRVRGGGYVPTTGSRLVRWDNSG